MSQVIGPFSGFSIEAVKFLSDLEKNNSTEWFNNNRERYDKFLVQAAKSFIVEISQFLNMLNPAIRTEPKFDQTIMRINKDMRFSKGLPYRNYFLIHFGRFKLDSEFYVNLGTTGIGVGLFLNNTTGENLFFNENLKKYPKEIKNVFKKYKINGHYALWELNKEPKLSIESFSAEKDLNAIGALKMLLLEKEYTEKNSVTYTQDFFGEVIKSISRLYPLYCFAVSQNPLKLLSEFEDTFGMTA